MDEVKLTFLDETAAFAEYEAGNLDMSDIPSGDMDRVMTDPVFRRRYSNRTTLGIEFYGFNNNLPPTDDVRVRKALSLAIDRQAIVENVNKSGISRSVLHQPGCRRRSQARKIPRPGRQIRSRRSQGAAGRVPGREGPDRRPAQDHPAVQHHRNEQSPRRSHPGDVERDPGHQRRADQPGAQSLPGAARAGQRECLPLHLGAGLPGCQQLPVRYFRPGSRLRHSGEMVPLKSEPYNQFLAAITAAAVETDPAKRMDLYAQAEKILVQDQAIVAPLFWYSGPYLVKPYIVKPTEIISYVYWEKWDTNK